MPLHFTHTPDLNKSTTQNYYDHLSFFYKSRYGTAITVDYDGPRPLSFIHPLKPFVIPFGRCDVFSSLHDRYDYIDELLGATIVPLALLGVATYLVLKAIGHMFTLGVFVDQNRSEGIFGGIFNALFAICLAIYCFSKSLLSLVTRPILTAVFGYSPLLENRFCTGVIDHKDLLPARTIFSATDQGECGGVYEFTSKAEMEWHIAIRPMIGFGN